MEELNSQILVQELNIWLNKYKTGRNEQDLRFGQYIWSKYKWPNQESNLKDGFYKEDPNKAYSEIIYQITNGKNNT